MMKSNTLQYYNAINYYGIWHALQNLPATQRKERLRAERGAVSGDEKREIVMVEVVNGLGAGIVLRETVRVLVEASRVSTEALIVVETMKMLDWALRMTIDDVRV
jgi:hypothetical protein